MRCLVTGGSGFLGEALVGRLLEQGHEVLAVARGEGGLIKLKQSYPLVEIFSGDIADRCVCEEITMNVQGVYDLAGFKHIRWAEKQPKECISTNVTGSKELLTALSLQSPLFCIGISTDKAAQVSGVYGASKLLMEGLFRQFEGAYPSIKFRIVRYGNVLYSTGSVLCKWRDLLQRNQPITITDPSATRFYWTVEQAVDLIFECLEKAIDASPYCPRMKSIRMGDLMEAMITKYGDGVYRVEEIGLQKGENKHESMDGVTFSNECLHYTKDEIISLI